MANEQAGFRTALVGFHKKDVLACIDRLSAENAAAGQEAAEKIKALQQQLTDAETKGTVLDAKLQENGAMVSNLVNQLQEEQKISADAREQTEALRKEIEALQQKAAELGAQNEEANRRLFSDEAENVRLKQEKAALQKQCEQVQAQLDEQTARLAEIKAACEKRLAEIGAEHEAELVRVRSEAEVQKQNACRDADARAAAAEQQADAALAQAASAEQDKATVRREAAEKIEAAEKRSALVQQEAAVRVYAAEHGAVVPAHVPGRDLGAVKQDLIEVGEYLSGVDAELRGAIDRLEGMLAEMDDTLPAAPKRPLFPGSAARHAAPEMPKPSAPQVCPQPAEKPSLWALKPERRTEEPVAPEKASQPVKKPEGTYFGAATHGKAAAGQAHAALAKPKISAGGTFTRHQPLVSTAASAAEHLLDELQKMLEK